MMCSDVMVVVEAPARRSRRGLFHRAEVWSKCAGLRREARAHWLNAPRPERSRRFQQALPGRKRAPRNYGSCLSVTGRSTAKEAKFTCAARLGDGGARGVAQSRFVVRWPSSTRHRQRAVSRQTFGAGARGRQSTRSGFEQNYSRFGKFFAEAMMDPPATSTRTGSVTAGIVPERGAPHDRILQDRGPAGDRALR